VGGGHGHVCHGFWTILEKVLTVGESAGIEERASRPHLSSAGLDGTGRSAKNGVAVNFAKAL
jgi:hypothetical protein